MDKRTEPTAQEKISGDYRHTIQLLAAAQLLSQESGVTKKELMERLSVSLSTAGRVLSALEQLGYPIYEDEVRRGKEIVYHLDRDDDVLKRVKHWLPVPSSEHLLSADDCLLLEFLFRLASGIPSLQESVQQLQQHLGWLISYGAYACIEAPGLSEFVADATPKSVLPKIMYTANELPKSANKQVQGFLSDLCDAVKNRYVCIVTYQAVGCDEPKSYPIMPLIVFSYMGGLYAIVETVNHQYTSKLALERIVTLEKTSKRFIQKTTWPVEDMLTDPFGLVQTDQFEADIWLGKDLVPYIVCRDWPSDRATFSEPAQDGSVVLHVITSGAFELKRWLRYLGSDAELLSPDWLRKELVQSIDSLHQKYHK